MSMRLKFVLLVFVRLAAAQTFEVASIRPAAPLTDARIAQSLRNDPAQVSYVYASLRSLIARAYKIKEYQVVGPDWLQTQRFDVLAKLPQGAAKDQVPQMLQALLAD